MKTKNLELELMKQSQQNKEIFFNETIGILDSFIGNSITDFTTLEPSYQYKEQKFIITEGEHKNHICFCSFPTKKWSYLPPKIGMVFFCIALRKFTFFDGTSWVMQDLTS